MVGFSVADPQQLPNARTRFTRRLITGLVTCAIVLFLGTQLGSTDAAWSDSEPASATFAARQLRAPVSTANCVYEVGKITINWKMPEGSEGLTLSNLMVTELDGTLLGFLGDLLLGNGVTSTETSPGNYTTVVTGNLLSDLLNALFGGTIGVKMYLTAGPVTAANWNTTAWKSSPLTITASGGGLGGQRKCVIS